MYLLGFFGHGSYGDGGGGYRCRTKVHRKSLPELIYYFFFVEAPQQVDPFCLVFMWCETRKTRSQAGLGVQDEDPSNTVQR